MKTKPHYSFIAMGLLALSVINHPLSTLHAQGTAFTYQDRLSSDGNPANGLYDFRFKLYSDSLGNTPVDSSYATNGIGVTNGLFVTTMDFGNDVFAGASRWLEVDVKSNGGASYMALTPLQSVTPVPYAIMAGSTNIALGYNAGHFIIGNNNIDIGNPGISSDNNIIRIGSGQTSAFINAASLTVSGALSATNTIYADSAAQNTDTLNPGLIFGGTGSSEGIASKRTSGTDQFGLDFYTQGTIRMTVNNSGEVGIGTPMPGNLLVVGSSGSPAYCNGTTWVNGSDRNAKEAFTAINPRAMLEKVSALPITEWKYKVEADGTEHIGPMAQDFHAAFGLNGADDKRIATVDEEGVALAAIQGLNQKLEQRETEIQALKARLEKLEQFLEGHHGEAR
jgi:hypothetical protein